MFPSTSRTPTPIMMSLILLVMMILSMMITLYFLEIDDSLSVQSHPINLPGWTGDLAFHGKHSLDGSHSDPATAKTQTHTFPENEMQKAKVTPAAPQLTTKTGLPLRGNLAQPVKEEHCECSALPDTDYKGGDLYSAPNDSYKPQDCCAVCNKEPLCAKWTSAGDTCYLKTESAKLQPSPGLWSGSRCTKSSSQYSIPDKADIVLPTPPPLVTSKAPAKAPAANANPPDLTAATTPQSAFNAPSADGSCKCISFPDKDFLGGDLGPVIETSSPQVCCDSCQKHPDCYSWTMANNGFCYLKHGGLKLTSGTEAGLISGHACKEPPPPPPTPPPPSRDNAKEAVKNAMRHAWGGYDKHCFGQDELLPLTKRCGNWLGAGLTIIDALSTLHIMGLTEEFEKAKQWVLEHLKFDFSKNVSFFETIIRIVGGLLSAYDFTEDKALLEKAVELGLKLMPAFNSETGLPYGQINLVTKAVTNPSWAGQSSLLAEVGTIQMEFFALSRHSKDPQFREKAQAVIDLLDRTTTTVPGLYPLYISPTTGQFKNKRISFGGCGDSFYEYLLKVWLLTGKKLPQYKRMYKESMDGMLSHMLTYNSAGQAYLPFLENNHKKHEMEHLACFAAGMLALGAVSGILDDPEDIKAHLQAGADLAETCYMMYHVMPSGVGPEAATFTGANIVARDTAYHLRPETVESLFILYRATGDEKYRDWGWEIFIAVEKLCRTEVGYVGLKNVNSKDGGKKLDKQESFFLAETLKYLYLLFDDDAATTLPLAGLDEGDRTFVFNTEAHPIRAWVD